jgi:dTDP-4-dehydrorhamnose 3,5-epimerase
MIEGVKVTPLDIIQTTGGGVMHAMKKSDMGFVGFGEAYFSTIEHGVIRAWKRHTSMTLNIIVPVGSIKFVLFDDRTKAEEKFQEIIVSRDNYCRISVSPMIWMGFQGLSKDSSILLNIADIEHNLNEVDRRTIEQIDYDWRMN